MIELYVIGGGLAFGFSLGLPLGFWLGARLERERCANLAEDIDIPMPEWVVTPNDTDAITDQARMAIAYAIREPGK